MTTPRILVVAVIIGGLALATFAQTPASQPAASTPAMLAAIIQDLGSADLAQRDLAQKQLDQTTWHDLGNLEKAADSAADPQIKSLLLARFGAISEQAAADPPPISIELKDAPVSAVADALSKVLGIPLRPSTTTTDQAGVTFTLSAKEKPFWEVFMALSGQHGLEIRSIANHPLELSFSDRWRHGTIAGPVAIFPVEVQWMASSDLPNPPSPDPKTIVPVLNSMVAFDPRLIPTSYSVPVFTDIVDDAGNVLLRNPKPKENFVPSEGRSGLVCYVFPIMNIPEKKSTRIVSAKGTASIEVLTSDEHFEIADAEKKVGQKFSFADHVFNLSSFSSETIAGKTTLKFGLWDRHDLGVVHHFTLYFIDANGRVIDSRPFTGQNDGTITGNFAGPFTIRISLARKTQKLVVPFEIKDIPLR